MKLPRRTLIVGAILLLASPFLLGILFVGSLALADAAWIPCRWRIPAIADLPHRAEILECETSNGMDFSYRFDASVDLEGFTEFIDKQQFRMQDWQEFVAAGPVGLRDRLTVKDGVYSIRLENNHFWYHADWHNDRLSFSIVTF